MPFAYLTRRPWLLAEIDMQKPECLAQMELEFVGVDRGARTDQESAIAENGIDFSLQNDFRGTVLHGRASVRERRGLWPDGCKALTAE